MAQTPLYWRIDGRGIENHWIGRSEIKKRGLGIEKKDQKKWTHPSCQRKVEGDGQSKPKREKNRAPNPRFKEPVKGRGDRRLISP